MTSKQDKEAEAKAALPEVGTVDEEKGTLILAPNGKTKLWVKKS